jgi:hypothetical protein
MKLASFPLELAKSGVLTLSRACFNRPKGEHRIAQGFSPGKLFPKKRIALKGRPTWENASICCYYV